MNTSKKFAVTSVAFIAGGMALLPATAAQAMPTLACDLRGTRGNDTLNITVPAGTSESNPYVVCSGQGTDTLNVNTVPSGAYLYIALGNGAKTINWNAGSVASGPAQPGAGIIVTPVSNYSITATNSNNTSLEGFYFVCGTNTQYQAVANEASLFSLTTKFINFYGVGGNPYWQNVNCPTSGGNEPN